MKLSTAKKKSCARKYTNNTGLRKRIRKTYSGSEIRKAMMAQAR